MFHKPAIQCTTILNKLKHRQRRSLNNILLLENQTERYQSQDENEHERTREEETDLVLLLTARVVKLLRWDIRAFGRSEIQLGN